MINKQEGQTSMQETNTTRLTTNKSFGMQDLQKKNTKLTSYNRHIESFWLEVAGKLVLHRKRDQGLPPWGSRATYPSYSFRRVLQFPKEILLPLQNTTSSTVEICFMDAFKLRHICILTLPNSYHAWFHQTILMIPFITNQIIKMPMTWHWITWRCPTFHV